VGSVKIGQHIIIDGEPCRVVEYEKSKPGKHGSAKARIVAIGIFDDGKRSIVSPVDGKIEIPVIEKRSGQVVSISQNTLQLMDMENYEVFEIELPREEDIRPRIRPGSEVEYWKVLDRRKVIRVKE